MISVIGIERRHPTAHRDRVVIGELGHGEQGSPVVLLVADERPKVGLIGLVEAFPLSVSLWVEGCRHSGADAGQLEKFLPCFGGEPGVPIGHDVGRKSMVLPNFSCENNG